MTSPRTSTPDSVASRLSVHPEVNGLLMTMRLTRAAGLIAATLAIALPAAAADAATHTADCRGSATACTATFPLKGTRTTDRLVVRLPDTDLQLRSILPSSPSVAARYGFGGLSMRLGGSQLRAVLLRNGTVSSGAAVRFTFFVAPTMHPCSMPPLDVGDTTIRIVAMQTHGVTCASARKVVRACISATGTVGRWPQILQVDDTVIFQSGSRRITFTAPDGGATCVPSG
jgi:hypothetical protein